MALSIQKMIPLFIPSAYLSNGLVITQVECKMSLVWDLFDDYIRTNLFQLLHTISSLTEISPVDRCHYPNPISCHPCSYVDFLDYDGTARVSGSSTVSIAIAIAIANAIANVIHPVQDIHLLERGSDIVWWDVRVLADLLYRDASVVRNVGDDVSC